MKLLIRETNSEHTCVISNCDDTCIIPCRGDNNGVLTDISDSLFVGDIVVAVINGTETLCQVLAMNSVKMMFRIYKN